MKFFLFPIIFAMTPFISFMLGSNSFAVNEVPLPKSVFPPPRSLMPKAAVSPAPVSAASAAPTPAVSAGAPRPSPPVQAVPIQSMGGVVPPTSAMESIFTEEMIHSIRDPFVPPQSLSSKKEAPKTELEQHPLKDFHLNGVIIGAKKCAH